MKKLKERLRKFWGRASALSAEILLVLGAFFIVAATATISITAMIYLVGSLLCALGFIIAKGRR